MGNRALYHGTSSEEAELLLRDGFRAPTQPYETWFTADVDRAWHFASLKHGTVVAVNVGPRALHVAPEGADWHPEVLEQHLRVALDNKNALFFGVADSSNFTLLPGRDIPPQYLRAVVKEKKRAKPDTPKKITLRALLAQANQRSFTAYVADVYEDEDERAEVLADEDDKLELLEQYLEAQCAIGVRDDGLVTFDRMYRTRECNTAKTIGDLPVVLYHHTVASALPGIYARGGLVRGIDLGQKPTKRDSAAFVFMTTQLGGMAIDGYVSRARQRFGGRHVMLEIKTTLAEIEPDPDDADISTGRTQFVTDFVPLSDIVGGLVEIES